MPSLADIPDQYLETENKLEFLHWLSQLPIDKHIAREFMRLRTQATGDPFDAEDHNFIMKSIEVRDDLQK